MAAELGPEQVLFMDVFLFKPSSMLEVLLFGKWYAWKSDCLHFAIYLFALLTQIRTNAVNPTVTLTPMGAEFWGSDKAKADKMKSRIPLGKFAGTYVHMCTFHKFYQKLKAEWTVSKIGTFKHMTCQILSVPDDVVNGILFLLSDKAAMINGILMPIDGGYSSC